MKIKITLLTYSVLLFGNTLYEGAIYNYFIIIYDMQATL